MAKKRKSSKPVWNYPPPDKIKRQSFHISVIADYGGVHTTDHAFSEVRNHFYRFDKNYFIRAVTEHPVYEFSTIETGFWIAQESLHSEHKNLVVFSNTAPRGDIAWGGEKKQPFVLALLDNGIPVFAVDALFNLSFVKPRVKGLWKVDVPDEGTQFRSRDQYPEATMKILNGDNSLIGKELDIGLIPEVPDFVVASVDGYGNLKTTIRKSNLSKTVAKSPMVRILLNGRSHFALNTLAAKKNGKIGDLCLVSGSSGGKNRNYLEIVRLQGRACDDFKVSGPRDDMDRIKIQPVRFA